MFIKEYPKVTQEGETILESTDTQALMNDFCGQLSERGITFFGFHIKKDDYESEEEMQDNMGITFSETFDSQDLLQMIMGFLDSVMDTPAKLAFISQIQNYILSDVIEGRDDEEDDDYET